MSPLLKMPNSSATKGRGGIFKLLRSPGIDSKESIPPAYVARRAGTTTVRQVASCLCQRVSFLKVIYSTIQILSSWPLSCSPRFVYVVLYTWVGGTEVNTKMAKWRVWKESL